MASVNISIAEGQLGQVLQTEDGIVGMVMTGAAEGGYTLGVPKLVTSMRDVDALGLSVNENGLAYQQIQDFYTMAGDGAQLYFMLVPDTMTVEDMADNTVAGSAKVLLDYAQGKIRVLGIMQDDNVIEATVDNGINELCYTAATKLNALAAIYADYQKPFRGIVGATSYNGVAGDLNDLTAGDLKRVGVVLGSTTGDLEAALGLLLGSIANQPVQRKVSRVKNGSLPITKACIGEERVEDIPGQAAAIAVKGFITFTVYPQNAGYYWQGDPMATATTDDYSALARGRVIDKAHIVAYKTYLTELDDEVPVDVATGKLAPEYIGYMKSKIENALNIGMRDRGEIVQATAYINPDQNVLSTNIIEIALGIVPYGYSTEINVTLGFTNPAL